MPFVEILGPPLPPAARQAAVAAVTDGLCAAFAVGPDTVTLYFLDIAPDHYAHAGAVGAAGDEQRVFAKVHAYRRGTAERRTAAAAITAPLAAAYGMPPKALAVYFFDRAKDEVAHAGLLSCDVEPD